MPVPASVTVHDGKLRLTKDFNLAYSGPASARLQAYGTRFLRRLDGRTGLFFSPAGTAPQAALQIHTAAAGRLALDGDESYTLEINAQQVRLDAANDIGAMRGLETLLQLLAADTDGYYLPQISVHDTPRFPWRGLMLDTARHFLPRDVIERNLDGMAAVKLNVLHLHLTDNQGFRIESKLYPKLTQASGDEFYTQEDIRHIVAYAGARGIRVVPEFDLPAHATSWLVAYPELASRRQPYVLERRFGIFDPVLDPTREQTYVFLGRLFGELLPLFPDAYVHIGGDENAEGRDWRDNPAIQSFMRQHGLADKHALQAYFNQRVLAIFRKQQRRMVGWEEILHADLPKDAVVQSWVGKESLFRAARLGYDTLLSQGYYIDLMHPAAEHYLNDPLLPEGAALTPAQRRHILGGEATMWSEMVTRQNIDTRIWPRLAAIAERLWSPADVRDVDDMYRRLAVTSAHLEELGLTHLTSRDVIMRNLAGGADTRALQVLLDVVEPLKDYKRNAHDVLYSVDSPFTLFADAANADAPAARLFRAAMTRYLAAPDGGDTADRNYLRGQLTLWRDNHAGIEALLRTSPVLADIEELSAHLKAIAELGLALLDGPPGWTAAQFQAAKESLAAARQQGGRTDLQVVDPIAALLVRRQGDMLAATLYVATPFTAVNTFTAGIEGPAVDRAGNVYAANFATTQTIGRVTPAGVAQVFATLPGSSVANGIRFGSDGSMYVADYVGHTIYRIAMDGSAPVPQVFAHEDAMHQPNDIAITAGDVLYASDPDWRDNSGRIWRIARDGKAALVADHLGTANGIDISPDGKTLYASESVQRRIWSWRIAADGALTDKHLLREFADFGLDGLRVDVDGNLYVARYGKGTVLKLAPDGRELQEIDVLGPLPSNISFGGPDGRTAYVTEVKNRRLVQFRVARPGLEWQRGAGVKPAFAR